MKFTQDIIFETGKNRSSAGVTCVREIKGSRNNVKGLGILAGTKRY